MATLWSGQSDIDFLTLANLPLTNTGTTARRSSWNRYSLRPAVSAQYYQSTIFPGGAVTSCWLSFFVYLNTGSLGANTTLIGLGKIGTICGLYFGTGSAATKACLCKYDGTTRTSLGEESGNSLSTAGFRIDIQVTSFGASAYLKLYLNRASSPIINIGPVSTSLTGMSDMDCVCFRGRYEGNYSEYSEIFVADHDTRADDGLLEYYPNGDGDTVDWTGGYGDIDEAGLDYGDRISSNTNDQVEQVNLTPTIAGTYRVRSFQIAARACKSDDATPANLALGVKSGGSVDAGSDQALDVGWATLQRLMAVNPVTSGAFTTSELDSLQLQFKARA